MIKITIKTICNIGTGAMGFSTALSFAFGGYNVKMYGRTQDSVDRGLKNISGALETYVENSLMAEDQVEETLDRITGVTELAAATEDADFVIESVAEDLHIKQKIFADLDTLCEPHVIFATNTSGLSPSAIAEPLSRKDKFVVAHFWNPAHLVPLVEIVPGQDTSKETLATTTELIRSIGKQPVMLDKEAPGFIGNRLQMALLREALYIVESGIASKEAVDAAVKYGFGRRLAVTGPLESADLGGLDVFHKIASYLQRDLNNEADPSTLLDKAIGDGHLGAKTGSGLYNWNPEALAQIKKARERALLNWLQQDLGYLGKESDHGFSPNKRYCIQEGRNKQPIIEVDFFNKQVTTVYEGCLQICRSFADIADKIIEVSEEEYQRLL